MTFTHITVNTHQDGGSHFAAYVFQWRRSWL